MSSGTNPGPDDPHGAEPDGGGGRRTKVFISANSADYGLAGQIYDYLDSGDLDVFFSERSLLRLGNSDYRREIDRALDEAEHMVVVTTSREHVESRWVEAEWGMFINEKRSNRKHGNLITVVAKGLGPAELPLGLRSFQVLEFGPEGLERLARYLRPEGKSQALPASQGDLPARSRLDGNSAPAKGQSSQIALAKASVAGRWGWKAAIPLLLVALLVWGGLYYRSRLQSRRLTDKDTIVIADFANSTGDPVFDGTLRQGLSAQLEQSPFLSALSDRRVAQTLALMAQPKDARLTRDLAVEVCQRTASTASIEGSISSLGAQYVLGLRAVNCRSGDLLANEQGTANGKEQVLQALGQLATELREKLGEPKVSVLKYDVPVEEVTTPSLTALHAYSLGSQAVERDDEPAAVPLLQRATLLDPHFAMAYARLGACYENLGESKRADENYRKAYDLRERVSERENLSIVSNYEEGDSQNLDAARKAYELWVQTYPRDDTPLINLGVVYGTLGDYDKGLETTQAAIRLNRVGISYANLASFYMHLNRMDEARATIQEAQAKNLDSPLLHATLYHIDFFHHDAAGMERERAWLVAKPGWEDQVFSLEYSTSAYRGQFAKAREFSRRAADAARREDEGDTSSGLVAGNAEDEALVGNTGLARQQAHAALARSHGINVEEASAVALGLAGDGARAMQLAADLAKRFPEGTTTQLEFVPMIRASVALQSGSAGKALDALAPAATYELGSDADLYPAYLRGMAYLAAGQGSAAQAEFQKILDHPGVVTIEIIGALAHLQIGRAYAIQGDSAKAKAAYQDFLNLWKDADPDIPILKEAKAEYAKLH